MGKIHTKTGGRMGQRNYKPRHKRVKDFGRELHLERDRKQALYRGDTRWRDYSAKFLAINDECYACGDPSKVTDHLRPHKGKEEWFWRESNYIPLCYGCHNYVSAKFDKYFVENNPEESIKPKIQWLNSRRMPTEEWTPKKIKIVPIED